MYGIFTDKTYLFTNSLRTPWIYSTLFENYVLHSSIYFRSEFALINIV